MAHTVQQLAQARPSGTTAVSLYSPSLSKEVIFKSLVICNTSGAPATFRIFHDDNGTTYDETTALFCDTSIAADTTVTITDVIAGNNPAGVAGNIAVRTSVANALTFTAYGHVIDAQ